MEKFILAGNMKVSTEFYGMLRTRSDKGGDVEFPQ
jgi:hypothetical protein